MNWGYYLLVIIVFIGATYTVIPDMFLHRLGIGSWKRQYTPGVAITFDDGPNSETTPQILDILDEYKVKATFFVTGENAIRYSNLVKEIKQRGHHIGAHSNSHRYAWFMSPMQTWRDWEECVSIIENLTGTAVQWVRPPWGTFNLVTWLWIKVRKKRAVLWNVEGHDWKVRRNPEQIASSILRKTKEGSILVLHDAGGEKGAPENTVRALKTICRKIVEEQKLPLVKLEFPDWPWWRRLVFALWEKWERFFARIYHVERINSTNFLRLSKTIYKGPNLYTSDGRLLAKAGDKVGEIHFESGRLRGNENDIQKAAVRALRLARESLPELARYIVENPEYKNIEVFFGLTMINRGVKGLGFSVQDISIKGLKRGVYLLQKVIKWIYGPTRKVRGSKHPGDQPKIVWISRQQLLERWFPTNDELLENLSESPGIHSGDEASH
ncbi:polysaccharide deacetylase [Thermincola ferriacetica]|uniref:Polysaccharide deacetylase n=1 Tax=Thermincola ferriacetica TaxID=281456 RepID=A0A0L6W264_9FIRM|nr:polysaccharide deacetylase family protein [Thermincola ferriacetica]KNZ69672.1 polysaccharide deacetylase [Thermincola ferriacetica]